jgi:23S rRNA (adenine2030-N6)-methyltransferase
LLPPPERRGLVLIDPPYEAVDDFEQTLAALKRALGRWLTGIYAVWYPITRRAPADRFLAELPGLGREGLIAELRTGAAEGLTGCGMAILNPPWKLDEALREAMPVLASAMCPEGNWQARPL